MRKLKELWKISKIVYKEIAFRSLIAQSGASLSDPKTIEKIVKSSRFIYFYKGFMVIAAVLLMFITAIYLESVGPQIESSKSLIYRTLYLSSTIILCCFMLFFLIILQTSILFSPEIYQPIITLELSDEETSLITILAFLRIFDVYIISSLLSAFFFPLILNRNLILAILFPVILGCAYIFTLWLVVILAKTYFYRFSSPEFSRARLIGKIIVLFGYSMIFGSLYILPNILQGMMPVIVESYLQLLPILQLVILLIPPFSCSYFVITISYALISIEKTLATAISTMIFILLVIWSFKGLLNSLKSIPYQPVIPKIMLARVKGAKFKLRGRMAGLIVKDLKLLIRNPNYAMLLFMGPAMFIIYLIFYIFLEIPEFFLFNMTFMIATIHILLSPSILQIEGKALELSLVLPIRYKEITKSKAIISAISYILFSIIVVCFYITIGKLTYFVIGLLINTIGIYAGNYKAIGKLMQLLLESGESLINIQRSASYMGYVIYLMIVYCIIPLIIAALADAFRQFSFILLASLILMQVVFMLLSR